MRRVRRIALYVCTACLHAGLVLGQVTTATLRGRVLDPQGAPVPAASVTVTREDNAISRKATTGADGTFVIANIPPTMVDVVVSATGFSEARRKGIVLEVGGTSALDIELTVGAVQETVNVKSTVASVDITRSVVDAVMPSSAIEALPLNGRNFLELALLVPGNAPAPNFDPTKSNSVLISSAGQLGRGGNITIDGADNNDDVVGGPLQNVTQESVQEFQIATNRFTAESGRSASSVINVVTKSGTDRLQGSASLFARDSAWQSLPATYDRSTGDAPPFDREQLAGSAGGPLAPRTFWFGALEYRNQDGAVLVGVRDVPTRTIRRTFALAPLDDFLGSGRADWRPSDADALMIRYAGEQATDTGASTLDRAIGSASQRQRSRNTYNSIVGTWTRVVGPTFVNAATLSFSAFDNAIVPVAAGPQLTFPSIQDGSSFRVPQGTTQKRFQIADTVSLVRGSHSMRAGGEWQKVSALFDLGVFQDGRIELVEDFATFDHNGDGHVDDGDLLFAVTLRSGKPDQALVLPDANNNYIALFVQDDWRLRSDLTLNVGLRYELDTDVKNVSRVDEINPIVQPFLHGTAACRPQQLGAAHRLQLGAWRRPDERARRVRDLLRPDHARDRVARAGPRRSRASDRGARGQHVLPRSRDRHFPPFAPSMANPFTGFILPGAGASGINIIDNSMQNPTMQQFNLGVQRMLPKDIVLRRGRHPQPRHALHHRPARGRGVQPGCRRTRSRREPRVQRQQPLRRHAGQRRTPRRASRVPRVVHVDQDAQLRERRSDPVQQRTDRSQQPAARVRAGAKRSAASLHAGRRGDMRRRVSSWLRSHARVRGADGHPAARWRLARIPAFQRNAGGRAFKTGGRSESGAASI